MTEAEVFMDVRPEYSPEHAAELSKAMRLAGVPFCHECADWHGVGEDHSEV